MFNIAITKTPTFHYATPGSGAFTQVGMPAGISQFANRKPSRVEHRKRHYIAGQFARGLTFTEFATLVATGITRPAVAVTLAAVGGGSLPTGNHIGYIAFRHKVGTVIVHESDLSVGSNVISTTGTEQRQWTRGADTPETRVTHWVGYVSVDGALPREAFEEVIGTTVKTENVAQAALGNTPPVDEESNLRNARGVPPYARAIGKYHDRAIYMIGDGARFYYSERHEFESVGPLNWIELLGGETVLGGGDSADDFVLFGADAHYFLHGYDEDDFKLHKADGGLGLANHATVQNINGWLWFASPQLGPCVIVPGGRARPLVADVALQEWRDQYDAEPNAFDESFAQDDPELRCYILSTIWPTAPRTRRWVLNYSNFDPSAGGRGGLPDLSWDYRDREDTAMGLLRPVGGSKRAVLYTASCDGHIRRENDENNDDDDGDTYQKKMTLELPHIIPKQQTSDFARQLNFTVLDIFLKAESSSWTIQGRSGDDDAYRAATPHWAPPAIPASAKTVANRQQVAQTSHHFEPLTGMSGKGATFIIVVTKPKRVQYRGFALAWTPGGVQQRPSI